MKNWISSSLCFLWYSGMVLQFYTKLCQILSHSAKILKCGCTKKMLHRKNLQVLLKSFGIYAKRKSTSDLTVSLQAKWKLLPQSCNHLNWWVTAFKHSCLISCKSSSCHLWPFKASIVPWPLRMSWHFGSQAFGSFECLCVGLILCLWWLLLFTS